MSKHGVDTNWVKLPGRPQPLAALLMDDPRTQGRLSASRWELDPDSRWVCNRAHAIHPIALDDYCKRQWRDVERIWAAEMGAGAYHRRIWRPGSPEVQDTPDYEGFLTTANAALSLFNQLSEALLVVGPDPRNANAFGLRIRELLLAACTQVESLCKGVLRANGYERRGRTGKLAKKWNLSEDFVKTAAPLRLADYTVSLPLSPAWSKFKPFDGWDPSKAPAWWTGYNNTKHDFELSLHEATLEHLLHAMGAVYVMLVASFGPTAFGGPRSLIPCGDMLVRFVGGWDFATEETTPYIPTTPGQPASHVDYSWP